MELKPGLSAIVTGGANGIGKALSLALAKKGVFVTVIDFSEEKGKETALLIEEENKKFHADSQLPLAMFIRCDVTNIRDLAAAFQKHLQTYGGLDICINSAGMGNPVPFYIDETDGEGSWRKSVRVNLVAVIDCTRLAIDTLQASGRRGVILNLGSASGLYPMYADPIYSATKGGVVLFTRSLALLMRKGIRVNVLCPEYVETDLAAKVDQELIKKMGGYVPMETVVKGAFELITDETKAGKCLWISNRRGSEYWPTHAEEKKYLVNPRQSKGRSPSYIVPSLVIPQNFEKIIVHTLTHNFLSATKIVRTPLRLPIQSQHVLVKILHAGVNASDVNFTSGRYFKSSDKEQLQCLPFDAGFEAVGLIAAIGDSVGDLKVGMPVATMSFGGYAEFMLVPAKHILLVPRPDPEVLAMLTSGLTASIALEKVAHKESGKVVLVTAAAGGTGQFAVQLAKLAGNKVVATCGGQKKAAMLKDLGVDRVIDYTSEDVKTVLKKEYPKGLDIVYESVGGEMFSICLNALAMHGHLVVIGMISQYQGKDGWKPLTYPGLCEKLLAKSQTVSGFFLVQYVHLWQEHLDRLFDLYSSGKLKVFVDPKKFVGISSVADAVEYLHSGKSIGKVIVSIDPTLHQKVAKL
ncbi:hypothetical protein H6P81_010884 [Aristolochia fimbriata]|uniref:Enoyl reductase (ER) domain-containing protein n=1 Tax=Aristolochia fimbriata TaxID=158543 RepID=A0AAV7EQN5_ARIFI|nr:hypothetical protein H6P81_010884 [Aristolochia fimbriata]